MTSSASRLHELRRLPRDARSFYAISDMDTARRIGGILWIFAALSVAFLMPIWPPTGRIGTGGWAVGTGVVLVCLLSAYPLLRTPERVPPNALLSMSYAAVSLLVLLVWIGGDPYSELYILPVIYAAAVHPPRRVACVFAAVAAGLALPLAYDGWSSVLAAQMAAKLLLWFSLGFVAMLFAATVRVGRLDLVAGEQEARALARRDPLTGLGNRRAFDEVLERVASGGRRSDRPLSLVIADIEGFKAVNDTYGHLEGDRCLRETAAVLAATVRPSDAAFRWGGDEFAVILPSTAAGQAEVVVDRVASAVAEGVESPGGGALRLRYGIAEITPGMSAKDLMAAADLALMSSRPAPDGGDPAGRADGQPAGQRLGR